MPEFWDSEALTGRIYKTYASVFDALIKRNATSVMRESHTFLKTKTLAEISNPSDWIIISWATEA